MKSSSFVKTEPFVAGIDIGGTKIAAGYIDSGRLVETGVEATIVGDGQANINTIRRMLAHPALAAANQIGVSMATTMEADGTLRDPHNWFGWKGADLAALLVADNPGVRFTIIADAEAGALGEYRLGAGRDDERSLYLTVGTGIAHCFIESGRALRGAHNAAFFSGYTIPARCAWAGCDAPYVERISSGTAIAEDYFGDARADARLVFEQARLGDAHASDVVEHAAWHLGVLLADLMLIYDPDAVVIGGGLGSGAHSFRERAIEIAREQVSVAHTKSIPIKAAALGSSSCWAGAIVAILGAEPHQSLTMREQGVLR
jgi:glucokinase